MKNYTHLIIIIVLTVILTTTMLHYLDGVSISLINRAEYSQLVNTTIQLQNRITKTEQLLNKVITSHNNLLSILKNNSNSTKKTK